MLIALAAEVGDPLAAEEGEVAMHTAAHRTVGEVPPGLVVLLAIEDVVAQGGDIEIHRNGRKALQRDRRSHAGSVATVEGLSQHEIVHVVELHACFDEHPDDLREGLLSVDGGVGGGSDEGSVHEVCQVMSIEAKRRLPEI